MSRGLARHAARKDANHGEIVRALEKVGASVQAMSIKDVPDLLVGFRGVTDILEVKTFDGELSPGQSSWMARWRGRQPKVVRTPEAALRAIGAIK